MASRTAQVVSPLRAPGPLWRGWALTLLSAVLLAVAVAVVRPFELAGVVPDGSKWAALGLVLAGIVAGVFGVGAVAARTRGLVPALLVLALFLLAAEATLRAFAVPPGLIPTPSRIWSALIAARAVLLMDARVTFLQETLVGYIGGTLVGCLLAVLIVRFRFLERGLMPYAALASSIPIVALAPVVVKAYGLEWPSKAIIVGITVFFPVLVNVVRGLQSASPLHLDLMRTYAVSPARTFLLVRLPASLPFLFNALKIASTLALIGAIVGEFFGTTGHGLGFRIQIEAGRFNLDIVWAAIVVASVIGIAFYAVIGWLEARVEPGGQRPAASGQP